MGDRFGRDDASRHGRPPGSRALGDRARSARRVRRIPQRPRGPAHSRVAAVVVLGLVAAAATASHVALAQPARAQAQAFALEGGRAVVIDATVIGKVEPAGDGGVGIRRSRRSPRGRRRSVSRCDSTSRSESTPGDVDRTGALDVGARVEIVGTAHAAQPGDRSVLSVRARSVSVKNPATGVLAVAATLRDGLVESTRGLPDPGAGLIPGLAVGDTSAVSSELDAAMKQSSLSHLTAVSGANCAIVVGLAFAAVAVAGGSRRARVVGGLSTLARLRRPGDPRAQRGPRRDDGRDRDARRAAGSHRCGHGDPLARGHGAAGRRSLARRVRSDSHSRRSPPPRSCSSRGRSPTVSDGGCRGPWRSRCRCPSRPNSRADRSSSSSRRQCRLYGVVANLLAAPAAPVATIVGLAACLAGPLPWVQSGLTAIAWLPASWIAGTAHAVVSLPADQIPWIEGWAGMAALSATGIAIGVVVVAPRGGRRAVGGRARHPSWSSLSSSASSAGGAALASVAGRWTIPQTWSVLACDVGQGDAVLLRSAGSVALIDTGPDAERSGPLPRARRRRPPRPARPDPFRSRSRGRGRLRWPDECDTVVHGPPASPSDDGVLAALRGGGAR